MSEPSSSQPTLPASQPPQPSQEPPTKKEESSPTPPAATATAAPDPEPEPSTSTSAPAPAPPTETTSALPKPEHGASATTPTVKQEPDQTENNQELDDAAIERDMEMNTTADDNSNNNDDANNTAATAGGENAEAESGPAVGASTAPGTIPADVDPLEAALPRKETSLREFLGKMDDYAPIVSIRARREGDGFETLSLFSQESHLTTNLSSSSSFI